MLAANTQGTRNRARAERPSLLAGRIVDDAGQPLIASHASKAAKAGAGKVRYHYYVSACLQDGSATTGLRLPAREVDTLVTGQLAALIADPLALIDRAGLDVPAHALDAYVGQTAIVAARVRVREHALVRALVAQVRVRQGAVEIDCATAALGEAAGMALNPDATPTLRLTAAVRLTRTGRAMRLVEGGQAVTGGPDPALVRLLAKARGYWLELRRGVLTISELAARERISPAYVTRVLRLAFLSPALVEQILAGKQPVGCTAVALLKTDAVSGVWA